MHDILSYLYHQGVAHWPAIVAFVGSGGLLSVTTQVTKRVKAWEKDATIQKFVVLTGLVGVMAQWYLTNYSTHFANAVTPFVWWPAVTAILFTIATFLHKFPVTQLDTKLTSYFGPIFKAADELKAEAKPLNTTANEVPATSEEFKIQG